VLNEITLCEPDDDEVMSGEGILPSNVNNSAFLEKWHFARELRILIK
jgi:hypothetical protein